MDVVIRIAILFTAFFICAVANASGENEPSINPGTKVYFLSPTDGETVTNPVVVRFGLSGMGVAPAGVAKDNTGHHHLLIDLETLPDMTKPIPSDKNHRHFGGGQTEVVLELAPGEHRLQLLLGDYAHTPHNPPVVSEQIKILVK
jgi:hypothetical protein